MGRLLMLHLAWNNINISFKFELDSYHAILALLEEGAGWTILTPLALRRARRLIRQIDVVQLPTEPLTRTISLTARRNILQDTPERMAITLRSILRESIFKPMISFHPYHENMVEVLD